MNFIVRKSADFSCVQVVKERLDSFIAPELKAKLVMLASSQERNIIVNLEECMYCDSSGLSALLVGKRLCEDADGTFIICNLSMNVEKLIKLAMLDTILDIATNFAEAEKLLIMKSQL